MKRHRNLRYGISPTQCQRMKVSGWPSRSSRGLVRVGEDGGILVLLSRERDWGPKRLPRYDSAY